MNFFKTITLCLVLFFMSVSLGNLFADSHDTEQNIIDQAKEINKEVKKKQAEAQANINSEIGNEEPLPLNDPFVGDSSLSGGVKVISDGTSIDQKRIDLFSYKLVGIIRSNQTSFISLINQDVENITLEMNETLNDGVKLVDMNQKEAIFLVEESDSYLIMNFKNEIKETSEY